MNFLRVIALIVFGFLLAACGASVEVPNTVTETAELEIQIVASLPDSESIGYLEVLGEDGEVLYRASDLMSRFHIIELEMGETYRITAQASVNKMGVNSSMTRGAVSLSTEVVLVATTQNVVVDLRPTFVPELFYWPTGSSVSVFIYKIETVDSPAAHLHFVGGSYTSRTTLPIEAVRYGRDEIEWNEGTVILPPEEFGECFSVFDSALLQLSYPVIPDYDDAFSFGVFDLSWENESSRLNQQFEVFFFPNKD